ncbi:hemolysin III family protein [Flavobacteriaceae bacterium 3-367]|uniref:PAQR family membrane homeostasis protein TrhA n=1 Tax=Eudoraea algarum TaxID=3417568 RepID=UPI0032761EA4
MRMEEKADYHKEEKWNAWSHGLGILLGILGAYLLLDKNTAQSNQTIISLVVYSISIVLLFTASTLYHSVSKLALKRKLRILDHISIYYLIAGTYTPVCVVLLADSRGWILLYVVWGLALLGTMLKLFFTGKFEVFSLLLYLFMGWLIVFDIGALIATTSKLGLTLMALGGAFYTLGIVFYALRKIPYNHLIWHVFVLGGAISHWLFIYWDIL